MDDEDQRKRSWGLRSVQGHLHRKETIRGVDVVRGPELLPPFPVEAIAYEEDTCLVLSAPADVIVTSEHPIRVMEQVRHASPASPGSVVAVGGFPLRLLAVVHDLEKEPSCREEWVHDALEDVLEVTEARRLRTVGMQMLGTVHGGLAPERFLDMLREALERRTFTYLRRIWLISKAT